MERIGSMPTDELISLALQGNGPAFTALWDRHIDQLRSYIKVRFKNMNEYDADDVCSRSFEKAFRQIQSFDPQKSRFLTWLSIIARNTALDVIEQEQRVHPKNQIVYIDDESKPSAVEKILDQNEDALGSLIKNENEEERTKYVERLPDLYREVARKRLLEGMKYNEIAESLNLELNTVKTRIRRSKQLIDEMRKKEEEEV